MIREWLTAIRTPATPSARQLGYLAQSVLFHERARRREREWQGHIRHCHQMITNAMESVPGHSLALVLGSGPLVEIPMEALLNRFNRVVLVDMVHPLEVRRRMCPMKRVLLMEQDLSGVADALLGWKNSRPLPSPEAPDFRFLAPDFVLSANVLSQLPLLPRERLEKNIHHAPNERVLQQFSREICQEHLRMLKDLGCPHLIISDFETRIIDRKGNLLEKAAPFFDLKSLNKNSEWTWDLAPFGELSSNYRMEMQVGAFQCLPQAD